MAKVTFQVIDGADKGTLFVDLPTPLTIGRENGNGIRLNDERVSRFHLKVQEDHSQRANPLRPDGGQLGFEAAYIRTAPHRPVG